MAGITSSRAGTAPDELGRKAAWLVGWFRPCPPVCVCVCPSWFLVEEESGTHVGRGEGWRSGGRGQCSGRAASYRHASCDLQTLKGPFVPSVLSLPPPSPKPRLECPEKTIFGELNAEGWGRRRERERTESLQLDIAVQFPQPEELLSNFFFRHV